MSLQLLWREIEVYWCGGLFFLVKKSIHMNIFCWQLEKSVYTRHLNPSKMIMKLTALLKNSSVAAIALALTFSFGAVACGDKNETTPVEEAQEAAEEAGDAADDAAASADRAEDAVDDAAAE